MQMRTGSVSQIGARTKLYTKTWISLEFAIHSWLSIRGVDSFVADGAEAIFLLTLGDD